MNKNRLENFIEKNGKKYYVTIGLEIHAEMNTNTKMWCSCKNDMYEKSPNKNICPVCMAHPGTLPVPNLQAIKNVISVGLAINSNISNFTEFDRKSYFYPDIPKGYQISQYKYPIVLGGNLAGVDITRIHLEEDTAKSTHDQSEESLIDFNRAGVPLMELVTEPCIYDAKTAVTFAKELQLLLRYLNVSHADMEMGHMRVEVNLSVSENPEKFGTKVEVKNINSFKAVEKSIEYEIERHIKALEENTPLKQETRGFDEKTNTTLSQRSKENAADYRYFPDPDITKFYLHEHSELNPENIKKSLPEIPSQKRQRLEKLSIKPDFIELFVNQIVFGNYFDQVLLEFKNIENNSLRDLAANYIGSDLVGILKNKDEEEKVLSLPSPKIFADLIILLSEEKISSRTGKDLLNILIDNKVNNTEKDVNLIATERDLLQITDESILQKYVLEILNDEKNQKSIEDYKKGKEQALMSLVGQIIKNTNGKAHPQITKNIMIQNLTN